MKKGCLIALLAVIGVIACFFLEPLILVWLWNSVLVGLFPMIPVVTYWKAMGLIVLSHILFARSASIPSFKDDEE